MRARRLTKSVMRRDSTKKGRHMNQTTYFGCFSWHAMWVKLPEVFCGDSRNTPSSITYGNNNNQGCVCDRFLKQGTFITHEANQLR